MLLALGMILVFLQSELLDAAAVEHKSGPKVYFRVQLSTGKKVGTDSNVRLVKVQVNKGDCYNPTSGVFIAPVSGWYQFMFHAQSQTGGRATFSLTNEGKVEKSTAVPGVWDCASFTTLVHVKQGHHVSMRKSYDTGNPKMYDTQLAGYLLWRD